MSELPNPKTTDDAVKAPWKLVAPLKVTVGSMNYEAPRDIDDAYVAASIERS